MKHSSTSQSIEELALPVVNGKNAFIVDILIRGEKSGKVVELFIDTDSGVTSDLCAEVSRELAPLLDEADVFPGRYHLIVSSPGADRPLKFSRQYAKHIGRKFMVVYKANNVTEKIEGNLLKANTDTIEVELSAKEIAILRFTDIIEARVLPKW